MVKKGRLLGFHLLLWNISFSVNKWICLKIWGMYSHQTGWPVRACSLWCGRSLLLVWSLMWVENTGKKLSQVMNHLFTDPTRLDFHVALQSHLSITPAASKGVTATAQGVGLCAESHHFTSILGAWNGGPEFHPNQISLWSSDYAHGGHFAAALNKTPSVAPVWSPGV